LAAALAAPEALVGVFYDDGIYLALGRSLAEGHGYRLLYLPGAPEAVHYPFLYPAFLAGLWKLWPDFPANVVLFRAANAALMAAFVWLAAASLERVLPRWWMAPLVLAMAALSVPLMAVTTVLFAEPLFLALAGGACWAADRARESGLAGERRRELKLAVLAGTLAGLAALTRSIGVAVVAGVAIALAKRPRAATAAAVPAAAVLLPWIAWVAAHADSTDPATRANYGTYFDLLRQSGWSWLSARSLVEVMSPLAAISLPPLGTVIRWLAALAGGAILVLGLSRLRSRAPATGYALLVYLAIVLVWPYGPDRFIWAALPWLAVAFATGVVSALEMTRGLPGSGRRALRAAVALGALLVAGGFAFNQARGHARGAATAAQRGISETMGELLPWIREAADSSAVIAGEDEALLWLYTGRRAVPSYLWRVRGREAESLGPDTLRAYFDRSGVTHVLLTGPGSDAAPTLDSLLGRHPGYLRLVRVWPGSILAFEVRRG
jgi:hypothetical protein